MRAIFALSLAAGLASGSACAGEIVRWVDGDGVTHFGNPQFGPADAQPVAVAPANGMDVPASVPPSRGSGPQIVVIEREQRHNRIGWRGYEETKARNPRNQQRRY
ncbi:MAG: DUF4124 domain-containing protein [Pseudomonadales bacterium]